MKRMCVLHIAILTGFVLFFGCKSAPEVTEAVEKERVIERLAILPFTGGEGQEGDTVAQMLGTELTKLGYFQVVPRTAAIDKVMEEHNFQRGGLTDSDTIVELGKGANAKYVVSGHIQNLGNRKMISASIVNVETFQQVAGGYYEYDDLSEVREYIPELAMTIATGTERDYSGIPTLAILPFDSDDENTSDVLAQLLAIELANSGKYVVVSRTTTIENVMKEQNIQRSGLTDSDTISKLGIAMNADYALSGSAHSLGSTGIMQVQIIDVLSLIQENGAYIEYQTIEDGARLMPVLSYELTGLGGDRARLALARDTQAGRENTIDTVIKPNVILTPITYSIGDTGPGGGLIFYIDGDTYFECSEVVGESSWDDAPVFARNYRGGGYDDWYMPSKDELNYIYENLRLSMGSMGGFITSDASLWSSSEGLNSNFGLRQDFSNGNQYSEQTSRNVAVRFIRTFKKSEIDSISEKAEPKLYKIGDTGPSGGLVFYIEDDTYFECSDVLGESNWKDAFIFAKNYRGGGYDDWYLPSKDELNYVYENLRLTMGNLGGFISDDVALWSSSEGLNSNFGLRQDFSTGNQFNEQKSSNLNMRLIRSFTL